MGEGGTMQKIKFDYSKLLGRMKEVGYTQAELANSIGCSETTLNLKLKNVREFKLGEAKKICDILDIDIFQIAEYFFANKLVKRQVKR